MESSRLDRLTKLAAQRLSRRVVLKGIVGSVAAVAGGFAFAPLAAADNCNTCYGPCIDGSLTDSSGFNCYSVAPYCCSPGGGVCYDATAYWESYCYYSYQTVCDSGAYGVGFGNCSNPHIYCQGC